MNTKQQTGPAALTALGHGTVLTRGLKTGLDSTPHKET